MLDDFILLKDKIKDKSLKICILGQGYIGLPLSLTFSESGWNVCGFDNDKEKVKNLNKGFSSIRTVESSRLEKCIAKGKIFFSSNEEDISSYNIFIICVPTPLGSHREPDLRAVNNAIMTVSKFLKKNDVICLESTTYPGTTEELYKKYIYTKGFKAGEDIFIIFSPEREDPGNKEFTTSTIPKVLGGITPNCKEIGYLIYTSIIDRIVTVKDCRTAELTKLLENIHRSVNIGLVNELKPLADKMNIDIFEVINAAATKPFGFVAYYPGPGLGGHCIPIDPFYLTWKAKEYGMNTKFIELAGEINSSMPNYVISKVIEAFNSKEKALRNSKILIIGISYKKNIDDLRESPAIEIIKLLLQKGCKVSFHDPLIFDFPSSLENIQINKINKLSSKDISFHDASLIITDHDDIDYQLILKNSKLIIDTRGRFKIGTNVFRA
tara:strand:- start:211 stop:1524 length:1314 start_codon:yes stop_codon:yes gene_type:complete